MTTLREAAQQALEALIDAQRHHYALKHKETDDLVATLRAALAEPVKAAMTRDGWRQCAEGQRTTQFCGLLDAAVKAEREACAIAGGAAAMAGLDHLQVAAAIRARGEA